MLCFEVSSPVTGSVANEVDLAQIPSASLSLRGVS